MKKLILICLVGLLCLPTSTLLAQVADSPGADFLHRSQPHVSPEQGGTHRGGDARPDTFLHTGTSFQENPTTGHPTSLPSSVVEEMLSSPKDKTSSLRASAPATTGRRSDGSTLPSSKDQKRIPRTSDTESLESQSPILVYGEIINPDSLGPLVLTTTPYYVDANSQFGQVMQEISPAPGEFFDGVLNNAVRKFTARLEISDRMGYFSMYVGYRPLFEDFLIIPGDSLKINLDLQSFQISFAGKNAAFYELQYLLAREADRQVFDSPRQLVLNPNSSILTKEENIAKREFFKTQFGSKLEVVSGGKESLHRQLTQLSDPETALKTRLHYLDFFEGKDEPGFLEFIRLDLISKYFRGVIASIRNFNLDVLEKEFSKSESDSISRKLIWELENLKGLESPEHAKLVSHGFLGMEIERQTLLAVLKGISFLTQVESEYSGELRDRIKAGFLSKYLKQYSNPESILSTYLEGMSYDPWIARVESLKQANIPGEQFMDLSLLNLDGEKVSSTSFGGKSTLLYVYFSTCSHSADYFNDYLFPLYKETQDLGYQLIALSVDDDPRLWKSRLEKFSDPSLLNLNISGKEKETFVQSYEIFGFPKVFLLDESGKITAFKIEGGDKTSMKTFVLENLGLSSSTQTNAKL